MHHSQDDNKIYFLALGYSLPKSFFSTTGLPWPSPNQSALVDFMDKHYRIFLVNSNLLVVKGLQTAFGKLHKGAQLIHSCDPKQNNQLTQKKKQKEKENRIYLSMIKNIYSSHSGFSLIASNFNYYWAPYFCGKYE